MKKVISIMIMALFAIGVTFAGDVKTTDVNKLPQKAQNYLKYFNSKVSVIEIDDNIIEDDSYEVRLQDGTEIEFDGKGEWVDIDCKRNAVPAQFIPERIKDYLRKNYPQAKIYHIERKSKGYEVELSGGMELKFDKKGNFIRIDD